MTEDILKNVYKYQSKAELTTEEIDTIVKMFDTPEKFIVLRKMLQVLTQEERDIIVPSEEAMIDVNPQEMAKYGLQVAINMRADEKIRQALLSMYQKVKTYHQTELEKTLEFEEVKTKEEEEKREQMQEEDELAKQRVGENI